MRPRRVVAEGTRQGLGPITRRVAMVGFTLFGLVLAGFIGREALLVRLVPQAALTIAPGSPDLLRRAAEAEYAAGDLETAGVLARRSLARAPFNVKALRVAGLVEAQGGDIDAGDQLLTLAGNWSLRDGATHLWLTQRRLSQGQFDSAFAHADTLIRRRDKVQPQIFQLFTEAGSASPQAFAALARLLMTAPPWRQSYVATVSQQPESQPLAAALALALATKPSAARTVSERGQLYGGLAAAQRYALLKRVSETLEPEEPGSQQVRDSGFSRAEPVGPIGWTLGVGQGFGSERLSSPDGEGTALYVMSDGYSSGTAAQQLTLLAPGSYTFDVRSRIQQGRPNGNVSWTLTCVPSGATLMSTPLTSEAGQGWMTIQGRAIVSPDGCEAQILALRLAPGERRQTLEVWNDDARFRPGG